MNLPYLLVVGAITGRRELKTTADKRVFGWELTVTGWGAEFQVKCADEGQYHEFGEGQPVVCLAKLKTYKDRTQFEVMVLEDAESDRGRALAKHFDIGTISNVGRAPASPRVPSGVSAAAAVPAGAAR